MMNITNSLNLLRGPGEVSNPRMIKSSLMLIMIKETPSYQKLLTVLTILFLTNFEILKIWVIIVCANFNHDFLKMNIFGI